MNKTTITSKPSGVPLQMATIKAHVTNMCKVTITMLSGESIEGVIVDHDMYCLMVVSSNNKDESLIYKHAIGAIKKSL